MTNQRRETLLVASLVLLTAAFLAALLFIAANLSTKNNSVIGAAYHCPAESKKAIALFVDSCTGAQSEAFCYALAKAEYCSVVRRF